jgi:hypothetical protein
MPPRRYQANEEDEDSPSPVPVEPSGKALTDKRKQQAAGRQAAERLWQEILTNIQKAQNNGTD